MKTLAIKIALVTLVGGGIVIGHTTYKRAIAVTQQGQKNMSAEKQTKISQLTDIQRHVTQEDGTEPAFKNEYWDNKEPGIYVDVVSGEALFSSIDKYDSGTGWPSFSKPIGKDALVQKTDYKLLFPRNEVRSSKADSHLGHVFNDGPENKGGLRYCVNSAALRFVHKDDLVKEGYSKYLNIFK